MTNVDVAFCRVLLAQIVPDVHKKGKRVNKDAWVWLVGHDQWEFHGPDNFYWHGSAGNAYEARYKGWSAWLENPQGRY
jgi:hypothetical protein